MLFVTKKKYDTSSFPPQRGIFPYTIRVNFLQATSPNVVSIRFLYRQKKRNTGKFVLEYFEKTVWRKHDKRNLKSTVFK